MLQHVSDIRSSPQDQIAHAAKQIGRGKDRRSVFKAIYHGKKKIKTVEEIRKKTHLPRKRILEEGKKLGGNHLVHQTKRDGDTAYEKDPFYAAQKSRILSLAGDPKKLKRFPTKVTPKFVTSPTVVYIRIPKQRIKAQQIHIDDIDSFSRVRSVREVNRRPTPMLEATFKAGVKRILREQGQFKDWGGERNDLMTTRFRLKGKRRSCAFAFKGRGRRGKLTPGAMGRNGDQIQRLFSSPCEVFIVQYWDQIDQSVLDQMNEFAKARSAVEGRTIYYGVIDGQDSNRLVKAYPRVFR
ncbi:hypothetical protein MYX04_06440 [Nitrospiraceae bacterium AH_259_D15_M11_P09]|nr:hypothetical protein [Nitrospiraceae bacterium AH_259_D15_M11_P09]